MNKININNYEAYLLDLSEGNLSDEKQMELELFLIQHPELGIDLSDLSLISVDQESIAFEGKQHLKKTENELISETQFISYIEGLSNSQEKQFIEKSCALNSKLGIELELYKRTITEADKAIVYQNKASLKRKPKVIWLNLSVTQFAAAASVLFILGLIFLWPKTKVNNQESTLAKNDLIKQNYKNTENTTEGPNLIAKSEVDTSNSKNSSVTSEKYTPSVLNNNAVVIQSNPINTVSVSVPQQEKKDEPTNNLIEGIAQTKNETNTNVTKPVTIVETITENDDEPIASNQVKKKKGIWAIAEKALKSLNTLGVKSVDGDEEKNSTYALTIGGLNITHKSAENL